MKLPNINEVTVASFLIIVIGYQPFCFNNVMGLSIVSLDTNV